jgi:hypothetical protein
MFERDGESYCDSAQNIKSFRPPVKFGSESLSDAPTFLRRNSMSSSSFASSTTVNGFDIISSEHLSAQKPGTSVSVQNKANNPTSTVSGKDRSEKGGPSTKSVKAMGKKPNATGNKSKAPAFPSVSASQQFLPPSQSHYQYHSSIIPMPMPMPTHIPSHEFYNSSVVSYSSSNSNNYVYNNDNFNHMNDAMRNSFYSHHPFSMSFPTSFPYPPPPPSSIGISESATSFPFHPQQNSYNPLYSQPHNYSRSMSGPAASTNQLHHQHHQLQYNAGVYNHNPSPQMQTQLQRRVTFSQSSDNSSKSKSKSKTKSKPKSKLKSKLKSNVMSDEDEIPLGLMMKSQSSTAISPSTKNNRQKRQSLASKAVETSQNSTIASPSARSKRATITSPMQHENILESEHEVTPIVVVDESVSKPQNTDTIPISEAIEEVCFVDSPLDHIDDDTGEGMKENEVSESVSEVVIDESTPKDSPVMKDESIARESMAMKDESTTREPTMILSDELIEQVPIVINDEPTTRESVEDMDDQLKSTSTFHDALTDSITFATRQERLSTYSIPHHPSKASKRLSNLSSLPKRRTIMSIDGSSSEMVSELLRALDSIEEDLWVQHQSEMSMMREKLDGNVGGINRSMASPRHMESPATEVSSALTLRPSPLAYFGEVAEIDGKDETLEKEKRQLKGLMKFWGSVKEILRKPWSRKKANREKNIESFNNKVEMLI